MVSADQRRIFVTGGAGFIGSHLVDRLLAENHRVVVLENFNEFYSPDVKRANLYSHMNNPLFTLEEGDIRKRDDVKRAFAHGPFDVVVHLAAMAGVRPSLENAALYTDVNVLGTQRVVDELLASSRGARLVFGSSSSVYGARSGECFTETDRIDQPLSPYAASKAANEAQLYAIHHTTGLEVVCLRFFTVFGPRQRPDLAIHKFCRSIDRGDSIEVFGDGKSKRDYTYVADIVSGIRSAMEFPLSGGFEIINLGRAEPVLLIDMITSLEKALDKKANIIHKPTQIGDMPYTFANIEKARRLLNYNPSTSLEEGIAKFVEWYKLEDKSAPILRRLTLGT
ncbi:MAG TPA: NAD-dependent epimerase/dehydratase family protein [Candidatus Obscuribacterales bacterium]